MRTAHIFKKVDGRLHGVGSTNKTNILRQKISELMLDPSIDCIMIEIEQPKSEE